jgi:hypothetical protein
MVFGPYARQVGKLAVRPAGSVGRRRAPTSDAQVGERQWVNHEAIARGHPQEGRQAALWQKGHGGYDVPAQIVEDRLSVLVRSAQ